MSEDKATEKRAGLPGLRSAREAAGLEQADIAGRLGIARQQVSRWERGETSPSVWDALAVARVLGCTVEDLAGETAGASS